MNNIKLNKKDIMHVMENTVARLVNEGLIETETDGDGFENEEEYHFINENDGIIKNVIEIFGNKYKNFISAGIERYEAYADFGDVQIVLELTDDDYIYVSHIEGNATDNKNESVTLWNDVMGFIHDINSIKTKLSDIQIRGRR